MQRGRGAISLAVTSMPASTNAISLACYAAFSRLLLNLSPMDMRWELYRGSSTRVISEMSSWSL